MRIVQACPYAWDSPGGVQVHVRWLSQQLVRRGHDVLILAPGRSPSPDPRVRIVGRPMGVPYNGSVAPICASASSAAAVADAIQQFKPDIVHAHEPFAPSTSMFAVLKASSPVVATFHAYADRARLWSLASPWLRLVWRRIDRGVAVSNAAADFIATRLGADVDVVANGLDETMFHHAAPAALAPGRRLLFVNRLDPRKGFPVLVQAFEALARTHPDVRLIVAGDGADRQAVDALAPGPRARVDMLGALPHEQLPPYHAACDVFVSPAMGSESFGIVLLEAMAAGLPVVASDIAGYREVVRHGVEGLLVPPGDAAGVARAIARILDDPPLSKRLAEAGRARARHFSWDRLIARIEAIYAEPTQSLAPAGQLQGRNSKVTLTRRVMEL
jgi:phosphatidylinositol alpha-mannosyltransferase